MRADARRNYQRLLDAAREAFSERGADAAMDDIARRAGVGPGTLYRHFPNRECLLGEVYKEDVEGLAGQADQMGATYPAEEALHRYLRIQLDYVRQAHGLGSALKTILGTDSPTLELCKTTMRAAVGRLLQRAQDEGHVRKDVTPTDLLRLVHGVGSSAQASREESEHLLEIVLDGLRPR